MGDSTQEKKDKGIINLLALMTENRKLVIRNFLAATILIAIYSLIAPKWYTARTTILPPTDDSAFSLSSILGNLPSGIGSLALGGVSMEANIFLAILNSRTVMESVSKEFDLQDLYSTDNLEETVKALREHVNVKINDDGTITLSFEASTTYLAGEQEDDRARGVARDVANYFIQELDRVNKELRTQQARNKRIFIERRYEQNLQDLSSAEDSMQVFQQKTGLIALPEQLEAAIKAAAKVKAEIIAKEIELDVVSQTVHSSHSQRILIERQLAALRERYGELKGGQESSSLAQGANGTRTIDPFISFNDVPELGVQFVRLYREVKLQETLLEFLLPQYEQAKIEEAKDTPTVQVLDAAVAPVLRSWPKRSIMVLLAGLISIFVSLAIILTNRYVESMKTAQSRDYDRLLWIFRELRNDLSILRRKKKDDFAS